MATPRKLYAPELWGKLHEQDPDNYPVLTPEEQKVVDAHEIRTSYAKQMQEIAKPYSQSERESWFTQLKEADEYLADNAAQTPMLTALATTRGITLDILITKIKENDNLFREAIGTILGNQQKELDAL